MLSSRTKTFRISSSNLGMDEMGRSVEYGFGMWRDAFASLLMHIVVVTLLFRDLRGYSRSRR